MSDQAVVNTAARDGVAVAATSGPDAAEATSVWFKRVGYYAAQAVANAERAYWRTIERRLDKPSCLWTRGEVVRSYRTNLEGDRRFRAEAEVMTSHGYRPWLETHSPGDRCGGLVLFAATSVVSRNHSNSRRRGNQRLSWVKDASFSEARPNSRVGLKGTD
jgi:hypothetical protein